MQKKIISTNIRDGLRINIENNSYIMIRPSGTENYIRIFCEHPNREQVGFLSKLGNDIVYQMQKYLIN